MILSLIKRKPPARACVLLFREAAIATSKPKKTTKAKKEQHKLHDFIMKAIDMEKLQDVISIDLKGKTAIADYMIVASGTSSRQVAGSAAKLRDKLAKEGYKAKVEGQANGDWVIVDAGDVIIHLFRPEVRGFYNLEKLWGTDFSTVGYNLYTSS